MSLITGSIVVHYCLFMSILLMPCLSTVPCITCVDWVADLTCTKLTLKPRCGHHLTSLCLALRLCRSLSVKVLSSALPLIIGVLILSLDLSNSCRLPSLVHIVVFDVHKHMSSLPFMLHLTRLRSALTIVCVTALATYMYAFHGCRLAPAGRTDNRQLLFITLPVCIHTLALSICALNA